jgi:hypothetical protein
MNKVYQFTLVLDGVDDQAPNLEDALFKAGCDSSDEEKLMRGRTHLAAQIVHYFTRKLEIDYVL